MNIENALKIAGWMKEEELLWLARQASTRTLIAEIGSWKGRSTRAIADNTTARVIAVDTFEGTAGEHEKELADKPKDWLLKEFTHNLDGCNNVTAMPMPSLQAAAMFQGPQFDMIFIDAAHDYNNVKADILAWRPLLKKGGLFCGHDFDAALPGVVKAVRELVPTWKMAKAGSIWYEG